MDTGGAHPNSDVNTILWDATANKTHQHPAFFTETADDGPTMKAMVKAVIASLNVEKKKRDATETATAEWYKGLEPKLLKIGAVTLAPSTVSGKSSGLTFHYPPYAVGPYAEGEYVAFVPWETLKPYLTRGRRNDLRRRAAQGRRRRSAMTGKCPLDIGKLTKDLRAGHRAALARAITLIESRRGDHQAAARDLVQALLPDTGKAIRVGITGSPGVGKSTTIDALGMFLIERGHKVAVLAVDPSSARTGGSILGDKTRMARLAASDDAYIRPSPASGTLGGVAAKTREAMLLCEAAGFDVVLVETVGIGQSETAVCDMTDFFLALMLPGAGDELQGIKKGLVELADMIAINKADGDNIKRANLAAAEYRGALHILTPRSEHWHPPVVTYSALTGTGIGRALAEDPRSPHRDERLRRIRRAAAAAAGEMDVVDAGAADDGAAARRSGDPRQGEKDRGRGRRRPHHAGGRGRADRGDAEDERQDFASSSPASARFPARRSIRRSRWSRG